MRLNTYSMFFVMATVLAITPTTVATAHPIQLPNILDITQIIVNIAGVIGILIALLTYIHQVASNPIKKKPKLN